MMKKTLNNQKGIITLDFIFASMLVFGLSSVIFSFGMTLSVVEVVQYMSYASARNYSLAHLNEDKQVERGEQKFQELATNRIFSSLVDYGWFEVGQVDINADFNSEFNADADYPNFYGARIRFSAPILYKRIPFVGNTGSDPKAFQANIQSFLSREPTFEECNQFMDARRQAMSNKFNHVDANEAHVILDNGC